MKRHKTFLTIAYCTMLTCLTAFLSTKPSYNWDIFPYLALTVPDQTSPFPSIQHQVFDEARNAMPAGDFEALTALHPEIVEDPQQLQMILKYFEIKPLYILVVRGFHAAGFNLVKSTYLPSTAGYLVIGLIFFFWIIRLLPFTYGSIIAGLVSLSPILVGPARLSSPDMLCASVLFASVFISLEVSTWGGLIFSLLAIFIRPDAVLFVLLLDFVLYCQEKTAIAPALLVALLSITFSLVLTGPGILKEMLFTSQDFSPNWQWDQYASFYFEGLVYGLPSTLKSLMMLFMVVSAFPLFVLRKQSDPASKTWMILVAGSTMTMLLHYLLHPQAEDRFFTVQYLLIILGSCLAAKIAIQSISLQKS